MWQSEDSWQRLALSFHFVGPRDPIQVIKLVGKYLYPLSHLVVSGEGTFCTVNNQMSIGHITQGAILPRWLLHHGDWLGSVVISRSSGPCEHLLSTEWRSGCKIIDRIQVNSQKLRQGL